MKTTHTPTPWAINGPDLAIVSHRPDNNSMPLCVGQVYHIINYGDVRDREMTAANAAFIVRACNAHYELVAALQNAANVLAGIITGDLETISPNSPALAQARAALAKAKGE